MSRHPADFWVWSKLPGLLWGAMAILTAPITGKLGSLPHEGHEGRIF